ncbi:hypothetical protein DPMN_088509 [Dreissena polymorpha]|uniref:Uncharacterized protein n=1 Tax=Dreissena polymorpha TaxID=45954 RepID=A0A9D4QXY3_DREPO|nr:hypothetical protein DPMN_088509 [Dreissena polymorpha]
MYEYDDENTEDGETMYEYEGEIVGKLVNGQDGGLSPMIAAGRDELGRRCSCKLGLWCPRGSRKTGPCHSWCRWFFCHAWIRCCRG